MGSFESVHGGRVVGSLAMFDRMIFRGHLMRLYNPGGVQAFLWNQGVPLTRFGEWAKATTEALCVYAQRSAEHAGRPYIYLDHATTRDTGQTKEDLARGIAQRDGITGKSPRGGSGTGNRSAIGRGEIEGGGTGSSPTAMHMGGSG